MHKSYLYGIIGFFALLSTLLGGKVVSLSRELERERQLREQTTAWSTTSNSTIESTVYELTSPTTTHILNTLPSTPTSSTSSKPSPTQQAHINSWYVGERLKEIEEDVVLTDLEKDALATSLKNTPRIDLNSSEGRELLKGVLGEEKGGRVIEKRLADEEKQVEEESEAKLFQLSRKLKLSSSQESLVRNIIKEVRGSSVELRTKLHEQMEEVTAKHTLASDEKDSLRNSYEQMKAISEELKTSTKLLYQEKLKGVLTEEQYNAYLAEEAVSSRE